MEVCVDACVYICFVIMDPTTTGQIENLLTVFLACGAFKKSSMCCCIACQLILLVFGMNISEQFQFSVFFFFSTFFFVLHYCVMPCGRGRWFIFVSFIFIIHTLWRARMCILQLSVKIAPLKFYKCLVFFLSHFISPLAFPQRPEIIYVFFPYAMAPDPSACNLKIMNVRSSPQLLAVCAFVSRSVCVCACVCAPYLHFKFKWNCG